MLGEWRSIGVWFCQDCNPSVAIPEQHFGIINERALDSACTIAVIKKRLFNRQLADKQPLIFYSLTIEKTSGYCVLAPEPPLVHDSWLVHW